MGSEGEALTEAEIVESLLAEAKVVLGAPGVKKLVKELKVRQAACAQWVVLRLSLYHLPACLSLCVWCRARVCFPCRAASAAAVCVHVCGCAGDAGGYGRVHQKVDAAQCIRGAA